MVGKPREGCWQSSHRKGYTRSDNDAIEDLEEAAKELIEEVKEVIENVDQLPDVKRVKKKKIKEIQCKLEMELSL